MEFIRFKTFLNEGINKTFIVRSDIKLGDKFLKMGEVIVLDIGKTSIKIQREGNDDITISAKDFTKLKLGIKK